MGKLLLAIWFFLRSLVGAPHQSTAQQTALARVSPTMAPVTSPGTCSGASCAAPSVPLSPVPTSFSTSHFPPAQTRPLDTSRWVRYLDPDAGVQFSYPEGWAYNLSAVPGVVTFKPAQARLADMGGNEWCVEAALLVNDYQAELQRLPIPVDLQFAVEPITIANLPGIHFRAAGYGRYLLKKDGKAIEFSYLIINGKDYGQEAEHMAKSLVLLRK